MLALHGSRSGKAHFSHINIRSIWHYLEDTDGRPSDPYKVNDYNLQAWDLKRSVARRSDTHSSPVQTVTTALHQRAGPAVHSTTRHELRVTRSLCHEMPDTPRATQSQAPAEKNVHSRQAAADVTNRCCQLRKQPASPLRTCSNASLSVKKHTEHNMSKQTSPPQQSGHTYCHTHLKLADTSYQVG